MERLYASGLLGDRWHDHLTRDAEWPHGDRRTCGGGRGGAAPSALRRVCLRRSPCVALAARRRAPSCAPPSRTVSTLPSVDVEATFGRDLVRDAEAYERIPLLLWVLTQITLVAAFWIYARRGAAMTRESAAGPIGTGMLLGMLGLALTWAVQLPFGLTALWWDRRHDVSEVGYLEWALGGWAELTASFVSICFALLDRDGARARDRRVVVDPRGGGLRRDRLRVRGRLTLAASDLHDPANDPKLIGDVRPACGRPGRRRRPSHDRGGERRHEPGERLRVRRRRERRPIVLWDTLLDGRFSDGQVAVVLAHELGHHSSDHIAKAIAWFALFAFPGAWLLMRATRGRGGMGSPEAIPLALLRRSRSSASQPRRCRTGSAARWSARPTGRRSRQPTTRHRRGSSSQGSPRPRSAIRAHRPGRTSCSRPIRRSPNASRWSRPGRRTKPGTTAKRGPGYDPLRVARAGTAASGRGAARRFGRARRPGFSVGRISASASLTSATSASSAARRCPSSSVLDLELGAGGLGLLEQHPELVLLGDALRRRALIAGGGEPELAVVRHRAHLVPLAGERIGKVQAVETEALDTDLAERAAEITLFGQRHRQLGLGDQASLDEDRPDPPIRRHLLVLGHPPDIGMTRHDLKGRPRETPHHAPSRTLQFRPKPEQGTGATSRCIQGPSRPRGASAARPWR